MRLSFYWELKPTLLICWRHFGCECGLERAERLIEEMTSYQAVGGQIVIIAQNEPPRGAFYAATVGLVNVPILPDPTRKAYDAYGILEGKEAQIYFEEDDEYLCRYLKVGQKMADHYSAKGEPLVDNEWLLPAEFVIDTNGVVRVAYR